MSGRKIMYKRNYLDGSIYGCHDTANANENERNRIIYTNNLDFNSSYGSPFLKKGNPVKIKIIK